MRQSLSLVTILLIMTASLCAQAVNGSLVGSVTDTSNAAVPNAKVTLLAVDTGLARRRNCEGHIYRIDPRQSL